MSEETLTATVEPTARERRAVAEVIAGKTGGQALTAAGFKNPANPGRILNSEGGREAFRRALRAAGLSDEHIGRRLAEATNARKKKRIVVGGAVETYSDVDHDQRRKAVELAARLLDLEPPRAMPDAPRLDISIKFGDGSRDWRDVAVEASVHIDDAQAGNDAAIAHQSVDEPKP